MIHIYIYILTRDNKSLIGLFALFIWSFEYVCVFHYIDTEKDVNFKQIIFDKTFNEEMKKIIFPWKKLRDIMIHNPFKLYDNYKTILFLEKIPKSEIKFLCQCYEEDAEEFFNYVQYAFTELQVRVEQECRVTLDAMSSF